MISNEYRQTNYVKQLKVVNVEFDLEVIDRILANLHNLKDLEIDFAGKEYLALQDVDLEAVNNFLVSLEKFSSYSLYFKARSIVAVFDHKLSKSKEMDTINYKVPYNSQRGESSDKLYFTKEKVEFDLSMQSMNPSSTKRKLSKSPGICQIASGSRIETDSQRYKFSKKSIESFIKGGDALSTYTMNFKGCNIITLIDSFNSKTKKMSNVDLSNVDFQITAHNTNRNDGWTDFFYKLFEINLPMLRFKPSSTIEDLLKIAAGEYFKLGLIEEYVNQDLTNLSKT